MEIEKEFKLTDIEIVEIFKNTKGYNWRIKIIGIDLERLRKLNEKMKEEYGSVE